MLEQHLRDEIGAVKQTRVICVKTEKPVIYNPKWGRGTAPPNQAGFFYVKMGAT